MKRIFPALCLILGFSACERAPEITRDAGPDFSPERVELMPNLPDEVPEPAGPAAEELSGEAHFQIAYTQVISPEQRRFHLAEALRLGHAPALRMALDEWFLRAGWDGVADPHALQEIVEEARASHPELFAQLNPWDAEALEALRLAASAPPFDLRAFLAAHGVEKPNPNEGFMYWVWELAEEASRPGRFGDPDPLRTFQLVSLGGIVPAEIKAAVTEFHVFWQSGEVQAFDLCDYVTSGLGAGFCYERRMRQERTGLVRQTAAALGLPAEDAGLAQLLVEALAYFESQAQHETENHAGGSWHSLRMQQQVDRRMQGFLADLRRVAGGWLPEAGPALEASTVQVDARLQAVMAAMTLDPEWTELLRFSREGFAATQTHWQAFKLETLSFLGAHLPHIDADVWEIWLNQQRIASLESTLRTLRREPGGEVLK